MAKQTELSPREAAQRLGVTLSHVYHLLWSAKLPARRREGRWFVHAAAVEARLRASEARRGTLGR